MPELPEPRPEGDGRARRTFLILRLALIAPLVLGILTYLFYTPFWELLNQRVGYLVLGELEVLREWARRLGP